LEREFDLFLWVERESAQEVEVFGGEIRAVLGEIVNLFVCDAEVGELGDLDLKPVVGLAVEFELGGTVGEPVGNLCAECQHTAVLALRGRVHLLMSGKYFRTAHCMVSL
jgi:hypothetical protein